MRSRISSSIILILILTISFLQCSKKVDLMKVFEKFMETFNTHDAGALASLFTEDAIIINPTAIIGPHDYQLSHLGEALLALACGKLPALVSGGYDWVDVRDVVAGAIRAEERAQTGAQYIMSGHWVSIRDLAALVEKLTGTRAPRMVCPIWLARIGVPIVDSFRSQDGKRPLYTSMSLKTLNSNRNISHARATRDLDYQPRPFRETLIDTLQWFTENGLLADPPKLQSTETL